MTLETRDEELERLRRQEALDHRAPRSRFSLWIILLIVLLLALLAWAFGFLNISSTGKLEAPDVRVEGGEVPKVSVDTGSVSVGSETTTVEVPTIEVKKAEETAQ